MEIKPLVSLEGVSVEKINGVIFKFLDKHQVKLEKCF